MKFKITALPSHPEYQIFFDSVNNGKLDRIGAISEAQRLSGVTIHDVGNVEMDDLKFTLFTLVNSKLTNGAAGANQMPSQIKHLVVGHAGGSGNNWFFFGNAGRVSDYINNHIPKGESAWVLACETGNARLFHKLEGKELVSSGNEQGRVL